MNIPSKLLPFLMVLNSHSNNNFIVGGAIRDILSGAEPHDYDLVTDIPMNQVIKLFDGGFKVKKTGITHLVLNVCFSGYEVEISNFRKDVICDGRSAEVEIGNIYDDAARRDFTINAVYINTKTGRLIDPNGNGAHDIKNKVLKFVGNPKARIKEDYLRVWRFYRFMQKGYTPDNKSLRAVRQMFNEAYEHSTPERVRNEIEKMCVKI